MFDIPGYTIKSVIHQGRKNIVYRACREQDNLNVIVKMLQNEYPTPTEIAQFNRQYNLLQGLDIPGIVKPLALEKCNNTPILILEDFDGESLNNFLGDRPLDLFTFLSLAIDLTTTIAKLHQHQIIHKDIKPQNLIFNPQTRQLKLTDFGISSQSSRENPSINHPNLIEGTLAYISPEQTGRMNRSIDYRTDFYSLGVTFYEMLTGKLPFFSLEAIELVHAHIAKQPIPPDEINPEIPATVSNIVIKLLSKNAEDRYQSALGLKADLETCLTQLQTNGKITDFTLATQELADKFQIPQKLYGRSAEAKLLIESFTRVSQGAVEMFLVGGYSGIGKSALINEIHKPILQQHGYFIAGKFDQFKRNVPYISLIEAFSELIRQLLTESSSQLAIWKDKILQALGDNAQVIIDVIPELELIIGKQPSIPQLPAAEAQSRFNLVFGQFLRIFTKLEHPVAIFLDDLQWADSATLNLLNSLLGDRQQQYLLLIGAYRDREVTPVHPLALAYEEVQKIGLRITNITLHPLDINDINQLIIDTFNCSVATSQPLAELLLSKTAGNPFFLTQILNSLYQENILKFDYLTKKWEWDLEQINNKGITDNVVDLMIKEINKLEEITQNLLKLAACIGNRFNLDLLAIVNKKSAEITARELIPAIEVGLVIPLSDRAKITKDLLAVGNIEINKFEYKFLHDRVQQAAYILIPDNLKKQTHLQVGKLLLANTQPSQLEDKIFDIVSQLNLGIDLISQPEEKYQLAKLNLLAGKKAKSATAYEIATKQLQTGIQLLSADSWQQEYELTISLYTETVEAEYLNTNFEQAEILAGITLKNAKNLLEKVRIYEIKIPFYTSQNKTQAAVDAALEVLKMLGIVLPANPNPTLILLGLMKTKLVLAGKKIDDLVDLPDMTEPEKLAVMRVIVLAIPGIYMFKPDLLPLVIFTMVRLSVLYGNSAYSAYAYCMYGLVLCGFLSDFDAGYQFGLLALQVLSKYDARELKAKVNTIFNIFIRHWKDPLKETVPALKTAIQFGLDTGDLEYIGHASVSHCIYMLFAGENLEITEQKFKQYGELMQSFKQNFGYIYISMYRQLCLNLIAKSENLVGESFNETEMMPVFKEAGNAASFYYLYLAKAIIFYIFKEYDRAIEVCKLAEPHAAGVMGFMHLAEHNFYYSLALLAAGTTAKKDYLKQVLLNQKKMLNWAKHAPANHQHKYELIEAEKARVLGKYLEAMSLYDRAINGARVNGYVQEEAIANERAAEFYLFLSKERIARDYLKEAYYSYQRWGAKAKVEDLLSQYPQLLSNISNSDSTLANTNTLSSITSSSSSGNLDLAAVIKSSQALSEEIILDRLLTKLMKIAIENAGAEKGFLILKNKGELLIEAEGSVDREEVNVLQSIPVNNSSSLSVAIVNYVARTQESVVINDSSQEDRFRRDGYLLEKKPKSILCAPLINQGKLNGILYLENNLTTGAFTPDRLEILNILSSQVAISIENSKLYTNMSALNKAYERFIPDEFLRFLEKESILDVQLGDQVLKEMTILFSDIRSFTTLSEAMTPQENFNFINSYMKRVGPVIRDYNGFIDKYIGDAIMALFPETPENAVQAAIAMQKQVSIYNMHRNNSGYAPISIGIGLHTGNLMLGTIGEEQRMETTVISDAVNLASRLEGLTKFYGAGIVISENTLNHLPNRSQYSYRFLDRVKVKGKKEPVSIFEIYEGDAPEIKHLKDKIRTASDRAISLYYQQNFIQAKQMFEEILEIYPQDKATILYIKRCDKYQTLGTSTNWDGVEALDEK